MLLFKPKGRPEDEDNDFYIQSKKNICVGCGERNHYLRYRIIPSCYRMHFPEHLKSHRSHDIVLLCVDCHEVAHAAAEKHKKQVAEDFGVPLFVRKVVDAEDAGIIARSSESAKCNEAGVSPLQLRTAAMALLRHGPRMPSMRREELTEIVKRYFGGRDISEEDLERALLVGMSPHERRRLERKKGLSFKHSKGSLPPDAEQENNTSTETSVVPDLSAVNNSDNKAEEFSGNEESEFVMVNDIGNPSLHADSGINELPSAIIEKNLTSDRNGIAGEKNVSGVNADDNSGSRSSPNGKADYYYTRNDEIAYPKHKSKLSLLGHGPHGKQVVDYLLKEHGDDGIRQFCQRWRQVFVEAVNPRFLPAGWDITHRV